MFVSKTKLGKKSIFGLLDKSHLLVDLYIKNMKSSKYDRLLHSILRPYSH